MTQQHQLIARYASPQSGNYTGNEFWLRIEQELTDDRLTLGTAAEIIDAAYNVNPCETSEEKTSDEIRARNDSVSQQSISEFLASVASKANVAECARRSTGDYSAVLRVIRSHLGEDYELKLSVGIVASNIRVEEKITLTINVKEQKSLVLDYPVPQKYNEDGDLVPPIWPGSVKWLGSVFSEKDGPIPQPPISGHLNSLSWPVQCTGTIIATYRTFYDLVTVEIPGIPGTDGATVGSSQNSMARAFYKHQVYEKEISMVVADGDADQATLAEVCGWGNLGGDGGTTGDLSGGSESESDSDSITDGDSGAEKLGCLQTNHNLADSQFYLETCCTPPNRLLTDCAQYATAKPIKPMDQSIMDQIRANYNGVVNFVAIGPGPEGCGRLIVSQSIQAKQCCDDVVPMEPHPDNPTSISPGNTVQMAVIYGRDNVRYYWRAGGGLKFENGFTEIWAGKEVGVTAPSDGFCEQGTIQVEDGCSQVTMRLDNANYTPLSLPDVPPVAPGATFFVTAVGGLLPLNWGAGGSLTLITANGLRTAGFKADDDFCGTSNISASDDCMETAEVDVRSTDGYWEYIPWPDLCVLPENMTTGMTPDSGIPANCVGLVPGQVVTNGGWRASFVNGATQFVVGMSCPGIPSGVCGWDIFPGVSEFYCRQYACGGGSVVYDDCCHWGGLQSMTFYQALSQVWQWKCTP